MPSKFSNIFNSLKNALGKKRSDSVVGVDVGGSSVKVVELRKEKGRAVLMTYGELALGPYNNQEIGKSVILEPEEIASAIKDVLKESNVTTKEAVVSIPLRSSLLTVIEIPFVDKDKMDQMIPLEARKYIPVPISEVTLDWWIIPKQEDSAKFKSPVYSKKSSTAEVLIVAIHNSAIEKYQKAFELASLNPKSFEIESFSAMRSVFKHDMSATMVIDVGASSTKIVIVDFGIVRTSHILSKGSQDITLALSKSLGIDFLKAEEVKRQFGTLSKQDASVTSVVTQTVEYLLYEANKILGNYQKKSHRSIDKVILIGGGSTLKNFKELVEKNFGTQVLYGDPFSKTETPAFWEPVLKEAGPSFAVAVGLALKEL